MVQWDCLTAPTVPSAVHVQPSLGFHPEQHFCRAFLTRLTYRVQSGHTSGRRVQVALPEEEVVPDDWPPRATFRISTLAWQQPLPPGH